MSVADAMTDLMVAAGVAPREKFTTVYSGMEVEPFLRADDHRGAAFAVSWAIGRNTSSLGRSRDCFI